VLPLWLKLTQQMCWVFAVGQKWSRAAYDYGAAIWAVGNYGNWGDTATGFWTTLWGLQWWHCSASGVQTSSAMSLQC